MDRSLSTVRVNVMVFVIAVGGLTSPVRGPYTEPLYIASKLPDSLQFINSSADLEDEEEDNVEKEITAGRMTKKMEDDESSPQMLISELKQKKCNKITTVSELELRKLERGKASVQCSVLCSPIVYP